MSTFQDYLKEQEEEEINNELEEKKAKIVAYFTEGEPVTPEKVAEIAEEMEMEKEELETEIYKILSEVLMAEKEEEGAVEDEMGDDGDMGDDMETETAMM